MSKLIVTKDELTIRANRRADALTLEVSWQGHEQGLTVTEFFGIDPVFTEIETVHGTGWKA